MPEYGPRLDIDRSVTLGRLRTFKTVADLNSFRFSKDTSWLARNGARGHLRPTTD